MFQSDPSVPYHVALAYMGLLECYLLCNERQHCIVYGDRFGLRAASLPSTDSCSGFVQRLLLPFN